MNHQPSRAVALLENTLEEVNAAVADCLAQAREYTPETDEFGERRSREIQDAAALLKMTAEVGLAIAKINGEFNHNITVARSAGNDAPTP